MKQLPIALAMLTTGSVFATPSGLNNIPTADTAPQGTAVFQAFSTLGNDRDADFNFGFKSGLDLGSADFRLEEKVAATLTGGGKNPVRNSAIASERPSRELFTLRADGIRQLDDSWLYSAGVLIPVCRSFVFEAWSNFPNSGEDTSVTLKANLVFTF